MLWTLLKAMLGVFLLSLFWVGVQQFVRRKSPPMPPGCDDGEGLHGCRHCSMSGSCDSRFDSEKDTTRCTGHGSDTGSPPS